MRDNLRQSKIFGDKKTREDCKGKSFPLLPASRSSRNLRFLSLFLVFGGKLKHFGKR
jgi:hypothetical protein